MARNRMHLMPEERENVDAILSAAQEEVPTGDTGHIANKAIGRLASAATHGAGWARTALEYFAEEGLRLYVKGELKQDGSSVRLAESGQVIKMPSRVGIHARDEDGIKENWQQQYWWELVWGVFFEKIDSLVKQRDIIDTRVAALREVAKLHDRYPETITPEEACERAGIDPRSFGIEGDALAV